MNLYLRQVGRLQSNLSEALLGLGKMTLEFGPDRSRTLVYMTTYSFHGGLIGEKVGSSFSWLILIGSFTFLRVTMPFKRAGMSLYEFYIDLDPTIDYGADCP